MNVHIRLNQDISLRVGSLKVSSDVDKIISQTIYTNNLSHEIKLSATLKMYSPEDYNQ